MVLVEMIAMVIFFVIYCSIMFEMPGTMLDDESVSECYDWHYCY